MYKRYNTFVLNGSSTNVVKNSHTRFFQKCSQTKLFKKSFPNLMNRCFSNFHVKFQKEVPKCADNLIKKELMIQNFYTDCAKCCCFLFFFLALSAFLELGTGIVFNNSIGRNISTPISLAI